MFCSQREILSPKVFDDDQQSHQRDEKTRAEYMETELKDEAFCYQQICSIFPANKYTKTVNHYVKDHLHLQIVYNSK